MTATVSHVYTLHNLSAANPTIEVTDTPAAGDVLILLTGQNILATGISAISGCGATWTRITTATNGEILDAWIGVGATSSGTVTVTAPAQPRAIKVFMCSGVSSTVAGGNNVVGTGTRVTAMQGAGPGQLVFGYSFSDSTDLSITGQTPETGWTESSASMSGNSRYMGTIYRAPTTFESHNFSAARSSSNTYVSQFVLGELTPLNRKNLVENGSFNVDASGWTANGGSIARDTAVSHSGAASIKLTSSSGMDGVAGTGGIPVLPNTLYRFSAWGIGTTNFLTLQADWYTSAGTFISSVSPNYTALNTSTWTRVSDVAVQSPSNAAFMRIRPRPNATSTFWIDDIMVEEGPTLNDYFDGDSTNTTAVSYGWTGPTGLSSSVAIYSGRVNLIPNPSFEAGQLEWSNPNRANSNAFRAFSGTWYQSPYTTTNETSKVPARAGLDYTGSAYVTRGAGANSAAVSVHFFNAANTELSAPTVTPTTVTTADTLQRFSSTRTAPAGTTQVSLRVTGSTSLASIDAALLEQSSSLGAYFDGSTTAGGGITYSWLGAAHASGSLATAPPAGPTISSALSGTGTLTSTLLRNIASALSGSGTLTSGFTNYKKISSPLSGSGTLTSTLHRYINSALSGSGSLSSALTNYQNIDSQLSGSGTLSSVLATVRTISSGLSGSGTLTSVLHRYIRSNLSGAGTLSAAFTNYQQISSSLSGTGTLTSALEGGSTPPAPAPVAPRYLGKLERFSVSTSAVPLNPADGSSSTPSVNASYTKGTDPEFMLGTTNVLKNGAIGTYEGEVVKLTLAEASGLASLAMNTPLTLLNNELHLFPFIDGVPGLRTAGRAIDYWTQQCGLFYDKVPGDVVAYASGYGHTDSYGASTTERFYEKVLGGPTSTVVLNDRSVRTLGAAVTATTALHEVKDGSVTTSLPSGKKLVFSIGLGLLGTGRTSTVTWSFLDNAGLPHTVSLVATSAGDVTAKLGSTTVATASVPAGEQYRLTLSIERSATEVTSKLTVHTDDLAGAGTLEHDGAEGTVTYALPGVLNLTSITHASAGGTGALMVRWGTYLTVAAEHPLELPAVQKVLAETKKPFEFVSGFEGNVWTMMAEFCAIARLDLGFRDRQLHVGPRTQTLTLPGGSFSRFENNWERRDKYKQVALVNKRSKAVITNDSVLWRADSVFQVAAREVFETTVQTGHSILSLSQPQPVTGILPFPYKEGAGQYVVTGADGYIIAPAWWNDNGGKVEVSLTGKEGEIAIKITAPALDNVRAPYRISEGAADRPALYICGSGIINDPVEVHVGTGARNAKEGFDTVFESPFLAGVRETFDTAAAMAHEYSASHADTTFELPNGFETPTGFGQFPAGTLFTDNVRNYRVMDASQTHSRVSGNAVPHTTIGAYVASYPEGATIADELARHAGRTIRQFNIKPLKGA